MQKPVKIEHINIQKTQPGVMFGIRYKYMYAEFKLNQMLVVTPKETNMDGIHYIGVIFKY